MFILKADGIRNLQDARFLSAEGFDYISFNYNQTHDFKLSVEMIQEISNWLSGTHIILHIDKEIHTKGLPENLKYKGIQSENRDDLSIINHPEVYKILLSSHWTDADADNTWVQIPVNAIPEDKDLSRTLILLDKPEDAQLLKPDITPFGICLGQGFQDSNGELLYEDVLDTLEIIRKLYLN